MKRNLKPKRQEKKSQTNKQMEKLVLNKITT